MIAAAQAGALTIDKLEAMTCVCSVGLDMIAVPGDTPAETISAIIADEAAIGMINNKTTAVRIIPAPGKEVGDMVEFGGLLGTRAGHAGAHRIQRGVHPPRRAHSRAAKRAEKLSNRAQTQANSPPEGGLCLCRCNIYASGRSISSGSVS